MLLTSGSSAYWSEKSASAFSFKTHFKFANTEKQGRAVESLPSYGSEEVEA